VRILLFTLVFLLSGCSFKVAEFYSHHQSIQNPAQVALVKGVNEFRQGTYTSSIIKIDSVNDVPLPGKGTYSIELMPGTYKLSIYHVMPYGTVEYHAESEMQISVEAGKVYQLKADPNKNLENVHLIIEEI
jgi:hypothetical protein